MMGKFAFYAVSFLVILLVSPAVAKKNKSADGGEVGALKMVVENQGKTVATVENQINEVVNKFQVMNGDIGRNFKKNGDQDKIIRDAEIRLQVIEDKLSNIVNQLQELRSEGLLPAKSSQRLKEYRDYEKGLEHMNAGKYDKAIQEFTKFKTAHKKSRYNNFAQYWIGEAYYLQSDYPMAIKQYQKLIAKSPKSSKSSTALYRQGLSFYHLQSFDDAKAFFKKVIRSYPSSIEAIQSSAQIARINNIQKLKRQQELEMKMVN